MFSKVYISGYSTVSEIVKGIAKEAAGRTSSGSMPDELNQEEQYFATLPEMKNCDFVVRFLLA